jgi:hypothetical protein
MMNTELIFVTRILSQRAHSTVCYPLSSWLNYQPTRSFATRKTSQRIFPHCITPSYPLVSDHPFILPWLRDKIGWWHNDYHNWSNVNRGAKTEVQGVVVANQSLYDWCKWLVWVNPEKYDKHTWCCETTIPGSTTKRPQMIIINQIYWEETDLHWPIARVFL